MNSDEAAEYDRQFWNDMGTMPPEVQDRMLAMAEQTPSFQESQDAKALLEKLGRAISGQVLIASAEDTLPTLNVEVQPSVSPEVKRVSEPTTCEPLQLPEFTPAPNFTLGVKLYAEDLVGNYKNITSTAERQVKGLGPKRAARVRNQADKQVDRLFWNSVEGHPGKFSHLADDPTSFCAVIDYLTDKGYGKAATEGSAKAYQEVAAKLMASGEDYVAQNADVLLGTDYYLRELLSLYASEMGANAFMKGPAGHLMRGYFKTANSPDRAVTRLESMFGAYIDSYRNRDVLQVAGKGIFLWHADFMASAPLFENLLAATISYHRPELVARARQLLQSPVMFHAQNLRVSYAQFHAITSRLEKAKTNNIGQVGERIMAEARQQVSNYDELIATYRQDEALIAKLAREYSDNRRLGLGEYLNIVGGQPGPVFTELFLVPYELAQRYEAVIGESDLIGDPMTDVMIVDDQYVIHFIWPAGTSENKKQELRQQAKQEFILNRSEEFETLEETKGLTRSEHDFVNYRFNRVCLGGFAVGETGEKHKTAYLRPRTKFDDEHTSPLADFDLDGFRSEKAVGELSEHIAHIERHRTRFVPKRGVRVVVDDPGIKESGLSEVTIRSVGPNRLAVTAVIYGHERVFQIKDYEFFDKRGKPLDPNLTEGSKKFASFCLGIVSEWMCRKSVNTAEGVVQEGKDGPIKGGYYSYLRVRQEDGYKYRRSDEQWYLCLKEKGLDLDEESERLKKDDETGQQRNSTYYREHPDDGAHLPPLRIYL